VNQASTSTGVSGPFLPPTAMRSPGLPPLPGLTARAKQRAGVSAATDSEPIRRALNDREKQVLRLVCEGMSNAEIALRLGVTRDVIKMELKRIFQKISVKNRTQAAVLVVTRSML
jgi:two-component system, NarL family, nitrate/nitrite response regulator NarL